MGENYAGRWYAGTVNEHGEPCLPGRFDNFATPFLNRSSHQYAGAGSGLRSVVQRCTSLRGPPRQPMSLGVSSTSREEMEPTPERDATAFLGPIPWIYLEDARQTASGPRVSSGTNHGRGAIAEAIAETIDETI